MPHEYEPSPELSQFEAELMSRALPSAAVDRDPLIYQAGYQAGRNSVLLAEKNDADLRTMSVNGSASSRNWRRLSIALATLSAVLGFVILRGHWVPPVDPPLAKLDSSVVNADAGQPSDVARDSSHPSEHDFKNQEDVGANETTAGSASTDFAGIKREEEADRISDSIEAIAIRQDRSNWLDRWVLGRFFSDRPIEQQRASRRGIAISEFEIEPFLSPVSFESNVVEPSDDFDRPRRQPPRLGELLRAMLDEI